MPIRCADQFLPDLDKAPLEAPSGPVAGNYCRRDDGGPMLSLLCFTTMWFYPLRNHAPTEVEGKAVLPDRLTKGPPRSLTWMARTVVRGPDAASILRDGEELYAHDRARGKGRWAAGRRYARNMIESAASQRRVRAGSATRSRRRPRPARGGGVSWLDVTLGLRMLRRYPGLTVVGGLGMAVGVAIAAGFFAFFYAHLNPILPLPEGDRLVGLENWDTIANNEWRRATHDYLTWREELQSVEEIGAYRDVAANLFLDNELADRIVMARMTASGFRIAGIPPLLGRTLMNEDESAGRRPGHRHRLRDVAIDFRRRPRRGRTPGAAGRTGAHRRRRHARGLRLSHEPRVLGRRSGSIPPPTSVAKDRASSSSGGWPRG